MADRTLWPLYSKPGIKRDGTQADGDYYSDGYWTRFRRGRPRKMGGYQELANGFTGPIRGGYLNNRTGLTDIYAPSPNTVESVSINQAGGAGGVLTRAVAASFVNSDDNIWQIDGLYDSAGGVATIIFHAGQNLQDIGSQVNTVVMYGDANDPTAALVDNAGSPDPFAVSGGVAAVYPYLFAYGNDGYVAWSVPGNPPDIGPGAGTGAGDLNIATGKVVKGMASRGGTGPSALLWSVDALTRAQFVGSTNVFSFNTVSKQSSILSSSGVVENDGIFYWPGVDRFLMYNGVVQEVSNQLNLDWFYENLNMTYRQKVVGFKIPRYGEICWLAPMFGATECNWAIILNVREQTWYDTPIDRSWGLYAQVFPKPVLAQASMNAMDQYSVWQHETGTDEVGINQQALAVPASITTADMGFVANTPDGGVAGQDMEMNTANLELDWVQSGSMTVETITRKYARSPDEIVETLPFTDTQEQVNMRTEGAYTRYRFTSNVAGGFFEMGQNQLTLKPGGARRG